MSTRRDFVQGLALALGSAHALPAGAGAQPQPAPSGAGDHGKETASDVGSLYPFIQSQVVKGEFPLSYLRDGFRDLAAWKARARETFVGLLHYDPPRSDPRP